MSSKRSSNSVSKEVNGEKKKLRVSSTSFQTAQNFVSFINKSPSPFHAVHETIETLNKSGFQALKESENWTSQLKAGGKYYVTRNESAIIAFAIGEQYAPGNGFHVIGAHTDSPCLKIKPISKLESNGWLQIGVECYGGGLFHTWFDRDLGIAGRVFVRNEETERIESKLILVDRPILRIPTVAIHLDREVNTKGFQFNKETHLRPVLATAVKEELERSVSKDASEKHHTILMELLSKELGVSASQIMDFELCLFDHHKATVGGLLNEFVFAPRLDNLCCSWVSTEALTSSLSSLSTESSVRMVALFDNEEIGSNSLMGAASTFLEQTMKRIEYGVPSNTEQMDMLHMMALRKSLFISADMAHAVHPNYSEKHENQHRPKLHLGPVIKYNANERYATSGETASLLKAIASKHEIDLQDFVVRQDMGCGSTIGPIVATSTGIRTLDIGIAQLSMHSIREMCGTEDLEKTQKWLTHFFHEFTKLDC